MDSDLINNLLFQYEQQKNTTILNKELISSLLTDILKIKLNISSKNISNDQFISINDQIVINNCENLTKNPTLFNTNIKDNTNDDNSDSDSSLSSATSSDEEYNELEYMKQILEKCIIKFNELDLDSEKKQKAQKYFKKLINLL